MSPLTVPPNREREDVAVALRAGGATLREIGDVLGVTDERARQLLARAGAPNRVSRTVDPIKILAAARTPGVDSWSALARALGDEPRGGNYSRNRRALAALGVLPAVQRLWRIRRARPIFERRARMVAALQALAAELGRVPRSYEFARVWFDAPDKPMHACGAHLVSAWAPSGRKAEQRGAVRELYRCAGLDLPARGAHLQSADWRTAHGVARSATCRRGHPFTPENTYTYKMGRRQCRACWKVRYLARRAAP